MGSVRIVFNFDVVPNFLRGCVPVGRLSCVRTTEYRQILYFELLPLTSGDRQTLIVRVWLLTVQYRRSRSMHWRYTLIDATSHSPKERQTMTYLNPAPLRNLGKGRNDKKNKAKKICNDRVGDYQTPWSEDSDLSLCILLSTRWQVTNDPAPLHVHWSYCVVPSCWNPVRDWNRTSWSWPLRLLDYHRIMRPNLFLWVWTLLADFAYVTSSRSARSSQRLGRKISVLINLGWLATSFRPRTIH